ncbi:MAG: hypothetical protein M9945_12450 [Aquamicrobium sp.]|uniref:hypothetical protein n=1 Tax=Aquamicrobium sp. TaxID=1872579 RepID=UPI00349E5A69|nr:hypothetical protein [Aquamicrobium sp.]
MASTATYKCKCCGSPFEARTADRKRGWAKFCSKSCKAIKQTYGKAHRRSLPRHDGLSEMKFKHCAQCGEKAVNGLRGLDGSVEWLCLDHMAENSAHPFSEEALGQWS